MDDKHGEPVGVVVIYILARVLVCWLEWAYDKVTEKVQELCVELWTVQSAWAAKL